MRRWVFNFVCILVAALSGIGLFMLKYRVQEQERVLAALHRQILEDKREIHILRADWAVLTDPVRLRALVGTQTEIERIKADQIVEWSEVPRLSEGDIVRAEGS